MKKYLKRLWGAIRNKLEEPSYRLQIVDLSQRKATNFDRVIVVDAPVSALYHLQETTGEPFTLDEKWQIRIMR